MSAENQKTVSVAGGTRAQRKALVRELTSVRSKTDEETYYYKSNKYRVYPFENSGADCTVYIYGDEKPEPAVNNKRAVVYILRREADTAALTERLGVPAVKATPSSSKGINDLLEAVHLICKGCPVPLKAFGKARFQAFLIFVFSFLFTASFYLLLCFIILLVC